MSIVNTEMSMLGGTASPLRLRMQRHDFGRTNIFSLFTEDGKAAAKTVGVGPVTRDQEIPTLVSLDQMACQILMDDLYAAGFRPTEAQGGNDQVQALKDHLADMRDLALGAASQHKIYMPTRQKEIEHYNKMADAKMAGVS